MLPQDNDDAPGAYIEGTCDSRIWGMTGRQRAARLVKRLGLALHQNLDSVALEVGTLLLMRADAVLEERLVNALMERPGVLLVTHTTAGLDPLAAYVGSADAGAAAELLRKEGLSETDIRDAGLEPLQPGKLAGVGNTALRKREPPLAVRLTSSNAAELERITFDAAYKGVTDFVTKFVWPRPAFYIARFLSRVGVTANIVTSLSLIFTLLFFPLVLYGYFLAALACGWAMALLDTVDGKLARVTLKSSNWGNRFDHGIDLVAPPLWWLAWWLGLPNHHGDLIFWSVFIVFFGHIAGKLVEQAFISTFGIKTHVWRKTDSDFRLITARRNPNLMILTIFTILGLPAAGYLALAVWILFCLAVHSLRYLWALTLRRNGEAIVSWIEV